MADSCCPINRIGTMQSIDGQTITISNWPECPLNKTISNAIDGRRGEDQKRIANGFLGVLDEVLKKNKDYGNSVWTTPCLAPDVSVETAIRVRMSDKIARIINLVDRDDFEVKDERMLDTVKDLGVYSLLLWLYLEGDKGE